MNWIECSTLFIVALLATILLVPPCKWLAVRVNAIDYPSSRRVNKKPIPRLGGIAIFGAICISLIVLYAGIKLWGWNTPFLPRSDLRINYWGVGVGILAMFLVGVIDDIYTLKARTKFIGQIIAACIVAWSGLLLSSIHNPFGGGYINFGWLSYPITVFYLVAFANIINLIDGLDGLAAGISAISAFAIFIFAILTSRYDAAFFSISLCGACIGFLRWNFNPASIFMGDSGALFLGFALGSVSLLAIARAALFVSLLVPVLAAGIPVLDTFFAIVRRWRGHQPIGQPDKGHIHHRLLEAGFSQRSTVLIMWGWTFVLAVCGVFITESVGLMRIPFAVIIVAVTAYVIIRLRLLEPVLLHHYNPRSHRRSSPPTQQVYDQAKDDDSPASASTDGDQIESEVEESGV